MADLIERARNLYGQGRFADAIELLAPAVAEPNPAGAALLLAGHCRFRLGLRKEALELYRRSAAADPSLPELPVCLAAWRDDAALLSEEEQEALLPGFSLPRDKNIEARRFLDLVAAPNLSTVYTNDNLIVFQRALIFLREARFMESLNKASESPMGGFDDRTWRAHILLWAARNALNLEGDFAELGTFRAYFASCITQCLDFGALDRRLYLYDTFEGLPEDAEKEDLPASFYTSLKQHYSAPDICDSVRARFAALPNVRVIRGKVPDTLHEACPERIAWLHIDLNSAVHEIAALEYLWSRITMGGFVILDDYGFAIFAKQTRAHQAFFDSKGLSIAELPTGQGLVIKSRP